MTMGIQLSIKDHQITFTGSINHIVKLYPVVDPLQIVSFKTKGNPIE